MKKTGKGFKKAKKSHKGNQKSKPSVLADLKEAIQEVVLIRQGKIKPKDAKEWLRELQAKN